MVVRIIMALVMLKMVVLALETMVFGPPLLVEIPMRVPWVLARR